MFKRLLSSQSKTITSAALVIAAASLTSRVLGLFRDRILAGEIGTNDLSIYYAAFRIPDLVFNLLVLGALSAGFIPVFTELLEKKDKQEAWNLVNNVLNAGIILLVILCALLSIFTSQIMTLIVPGFDAEQMALTVSLTRIMFLSPFFLGLSSIFGGVLQSMKRFFIYSLAPIFYNIGIIIGALYFFQWWGLAGLAWGVVLGAFLHLLIQLPTSVSMGYRFKLVLDFKNKSLKQIGRLMGPRTLSLVLLQINLVVITAIASTLGGKEIAIFNLANNLQGLPIGLFGVSFAIAAFPALSEYVAKNKHQDFIEIFAKTLRQILFFIIPASVLMLTLRAQIVRVVLGAGKFSWTDTILTLQTLGYFSLSLFAQSLLPLFIRGFYALQNSATPFLYGLISVVLNVILSWTLGKEMGVAGLALAFTISSIVNLGFLWIALRIKIGYMDDWKTLTAVSKISAAAFIMAIFIQGVKYFVEPHVGTTTFLGIFAQTSLAIIAGVAAFCGINLWLKTEEMAQIFGKLKKKMKGVKTAFRLSKEGIEETGEIK